MAKTMTMAERHKAYAWHIKRFTRKMLIELVKNDARKGNFLNWKPMAADGMSELDHHVVKLRAALKEGDPDTITEYCADIANIVMAIDKSPRISPERKSPCPRCNRRLKQSPT